MRIPIAPRSSRYGVSMTPMIDVVFLLIIFFLVSSHLAHQEHLVPVDLPAASSADPTREPTAPRLTITLLGDGSCRIAGRVAAPGEFSQRLADWRRIDARRRRRAAVARRPRPSLSADRAAPGGRG